MRVLEITLTKMSTMDFKLLSQVVDWSGSQLLEPSEKDPMGNNRKDHSILMEVYFKLEPKITKRKLLEPEKMRIRRNKSLKIGVHSGIAVLDALLDYWPHRNFKETPALEHIKEQITQQLL